jgi:tetratricopeptide (TPR) repeat protein
MEKRIIDKHIIDRYILSDCVREISRKVLLYNETAFSQGLHLLGFDWYDVKAMCQLLALIDEGSTANPALIGMLKEIQTSASKIACFDKVCFEAKPEEANVNRTDEAYRKAEKLWEEGDKDEAVKWFERAGKYGHPWAYTTLGNLFCEVDIKKALKYYKLGASDGIGDCEFALGLCYRDGCEGLTPNLDLAFKWIRKAALHETCNAGNALGECYENGWGCEKDLRKALYWYDVSQTGVENGDRIRRMLAGTETQLPLRLEGFDYQIKHYIQDAGWWENYYQNCKILKSDRTGRKSQ